MPEVVAADASAPVVSADVAVLEAVVPEVVVLEAVVPEVVVPEVVVPDVAVPEVVPPEVVLYEEPVLPSTPLSGLSDATAVLSPQDAAEAISADISNDNNNLLFMVVFLSHVFRGLHL